MLNTEHIIIGKTFATSVGVLPEGVMESVFSSISGRKTLECYYDGNGLKIEWNDDWQAACRINSPAVFLVMPVNCSPMGLFSERLKRFETTYYPPIVQIDPKSLNGKWFDQIARRLQGESDLAFEYRLISILAALFKVFKRRSAEETADRKPEPREERTMANPFDEAIFYIDTPTARYSTNDIKRGVASGAIALETPIHTADGSPCTAGFLVDINSTPTFPPAITFPNEPPPHLRYPMGAKRGNL